MIKRLLTYFTRYPSHLLARNSSRRTTPLRVEINLIIFTSCAVLQGLIGLRTGIVVVDGGLMPLPVEIIIPVIDTYQLNWVIRRRPSTQWMLYLHQALSTSLEVRLHLCLFFCIFLSRVCHHCRSENSACFPAHPSNPCRVTRQPFAYILTPMLNSFSVCAPIWIFGPKWPTLSKSADIERFPLILPQS